MVIFLNVLYFPGTDEFFLSTDFNSRHFLVGALLSELRVSLGEIAEVQRVAIGVLRDLLAKHAFDDRYLQSVSHFANFFTMYCISNAVVPFGSSSFKYILV